MCTVRVSSSWLVTVHVAGSDPELCRKIAGARCQVYGASSVTRGPLNDTHRPGSTPRAPPHRQGRRCRGSGGYPDPRAAGTSARPSARGLPAGATTRFIARGPPVVGVLVPRLGDHGLQVVGDPFRGEALRGPVGAAPERLGVLGYP